MTTMQTVTGLTPCTTVNRSSSWGAKKSTAIATRCRLPGADGSGTSDTRKTNRRRRRVLTTSLGLCGTTSRRRAAIHSLNSANIFGPSCCFNGSSRLPLFSFHSSVACKIVKLGQPMSTTMENISVCMLAQSWPVSGRLPERVRGSPSREPALLLRLSSLSRLRQLLLRLLHVRRADVLSSPSLSSTTMGNSGIPFDGNTSPSGRKPSARRENTLGAIWCCLSLL
mmetsp:Transcript_74900/g.216551  ORF Transcript_74900/g.216551 Transcript_74900/m.216551 type:complete len:225 (-) Transcript_74900:136-810(-)